MIISYTNRYQLLYNIIMIAAVFVALGLVFSIVDAIPNRYLGRLPGWLEFIGGICIFLITVAFAPVVYSKTIFPSWVPSWMYVRLTLGVSIDASEASRISFLFDGSMPGGVWYPLRMIRDLDQELRREALFGFANHISHSNGWGIPFGEYFYDQQRASSKQKQERSGPRTSSGFQGSQDLRSSFALLGITEEDPTWEDVKSAYRRKIRMYHPDKYAGDRPEILRHADDMTKKINYAYASLEKRYHPKA